MVSTHRRGTGRSSVERTRAVVARHATLCWVVLFSVVFGVFLWRQHSEADRVANTVSAADPRWVIALLVVNLAVLLTSATSYRLVLRRLGHEVAVRDCARIHLQRHVVGTVTPIGGPASIYVLIRALGRRGIGCNDALFMTTIRSVAGHTAFLAMLIPALIVQRPSPMVLAAALGLVLALLLMVASMAMLLGTSAAPGWLVRVAPSFLTRFLDNARSHRIRPGDMVAPLLLAVGHNLGGAVAVFVCLRALGVEGSLGIALIGFAVGNLFTIIAPVFQGLGVVELTMALALHQQGIPMTVAIAVTLLYRLGDVWFPLVLGAVSHLAGIERVRLAATSIAPAASGGVVAALFMVTPLQARAVDLFNIPLSLDSPQLAALGAAVVGSVWVSGSMLGAWRRQAMLRFAPIACTVLAVPLLSIAAVSLDLPMLF